MDSFGDEDYSHTLYSQKITERYCIALFLVN